MARDVGDSEFDVAEAQQALAAGDLARAQATFELADPYQRKLLIST